MDLLIFKILLTYHGQVVEKAVIETVVEAVVEKAVSLQTKIVAANTFV